jgi:hypothetical protein
VHPARCVRCRGTTTDVDDLVAAIVLDAVEQAATVHLYDDDSLAPIGGIGALTRF